MDRFAKFIANNGSVIVKSKLVVLASSLSVRVYTLDNGKEFVVIEHYAMISWDGLFTQAPHSDYYETRALATEIIAKFNKQ